MYSCSLFLLCGLVRPHEVRTKISGRRSVSCKTDFEEKKPDCFAVLGAGRDGCLRRLRKSLSKLNAETSLWTGLWSSGELGEVLTYWSRSVLCCGTLWGRPFSTSVQPSKTCLESRCLSLDENFRAKEGGKEKTSLFFLLPMVSLRSKRFCSS